MKILFTAVGGRVELVEAFHAAAQHLGMDLEVYGADRSETAPALALCDQAVMTPSIRESAYIPSLRLLCRDEGIDAVIPASDGDLLLLSRHRDSFGGACVWVSSPELTALCLDTAQTRDCFRAVGLPSPQLPEDGGALSVGGMAYTVDVFCDLDGQPIYITPRIHLAARRGETARTEICQDQRILREVEGLVRALRPRGPLTVRLVREEDTGIDWYTGMEPRFDGGAFLSMRSGADSAQALLRLLSGENVPYQPMAARDGAVYTRLERSAPAR
jgi:carbamoyl-phosphate synthase large subunit